MTIRTVGVVGCGLMGSGIAESMARGGYDVIVREINAEVLQRGLGRLRKSMDTAVAREKMTQSDADAAWARIRGVTSLDDMATCDLVIEAAVENLDLKREVFATLDRVTPPHAILASNTSSLSISAIAGATRRPQRVIGLHYFNPAHIMQLVEVIRGDLTADETVADAQAFVASLGKTPVLCIDSPAFIVNRVARPFYGEALRLLGERVADPQDIDRLITSLGFRMGPFELLDLIGLDVNLAVTKSVYDAYFQDPKYRPHPVQQRMVDSGRLGRKSGRGFYEY